MQRSTQTAVVLGGTYPHIRLLENLTIRGYRTILIDYHETPCAKPFADVHYRESTLDRTRVLEIARTENASLVISSCIDQANLIACSIAEELGLPRPYDSDQATTVTNKPLMKRFMRDHGIPSAAFVVADRETPLLDLGLDLPLIVKPSDSNSSKGVVKVCSWDQLAIAVRNAMTISRSGEVVIEEFVEGREIGIDCYIYDGKPHLLITKERRKIPPDVCEEQQIYGCFWPAELNPAEIDAALDTARSIARGLGLRNSPLMIQAITNKTGIKVIEFAARFGGGESFKVIELATGVDIIDLSIRSFLDEPVSLRARDSIELYAETFIYSEECVFERIEAENVGFDCLHQYKTRGMSVGRPLTSNNRVGAFIVSGESVSELREKIRNVISGLRVIDKEGRDCFLRSLYGKEGVI